VRHLKSPLNVKRAKAVGFRLDICFQNKLASDLGESLPYRFLKKLFLHPIESIETNTPFDQLYLSALTVFRLQIPPEFPVASAGTMPRLKSWRSTSFVE
jgi:hypothetical protein